jgi:tripartite motif-containing protein 71
VATDAGSVYAIGGDDTSIAVRPIPNEGAPSVAPTTAPSAVPVVDLTTPVKWVATSGKTPFEPWTMRSAPDGTLWAVNGTTNFDLFSRDGTFIESWGTPGSGDGQFDFARANGDPYGRIAFAADGSFYVLDPGNHRIQAFDKDRTFVRAWGSLGTDPGQFIDPVGLAVDADGNVNVLDDKRNVIETYSPKGEVVRTIVAYPDAVGANEGSNDLVVGPNGHLYLSMASPGRVVELDRDGAFVRDYGKGLFGEQAGDMAVDSAGRLYATQAMSEHSILIFAPDGTNIGGFAHSGVEDADIGFPGGLVVDDTGIYVTDVGGLPDFGLRSVIRKFAPIQFEGAPAPALLAPKLAWITDQGPSDFVPWSMAKAPDGRLWVALALTDRFAIFDADGTYLETWGMPGTGPGEFDLRRANGDPFVMLAFASDGSFYVLDSGNHRVQAFDKDRKFVRQWGTLGKDTGQFTETGGLDVDANGNVIVIDNVRAVIETYKPDGTVVSTIPAFPPELHAAQGVNKGANEFHIGPNGHYFLSLTEPAMVAEIDRDGKLVRTYAAEGQPCALREQPNGVAWDAAGRMYLAQGPSRGDAPGILVFAADGSCLGGFGKLGAADADLGFVWTVLVDESGIYVSDAGGLPDFGLRSAIRKFEPIAFDN